MEDERVPQSRAIAHSICELSSEELKKVVNLLREHDPAALSVHRDSTKICEANFDVKTLNAEAMEALHKLLRASSVEKAMKITSRRSSKKPNLIMLQ